MPERNLLRALITAEQRGAYTVRLEGRELPAGVAGKLAGEAASRLDYPVAGDEAEAPLHDGGAKAVIHGG